MCGFSSAGKSEYLHRLLTTPGSFLDATPVYEGMFRTGDRQELVAGDVRHLDISSEPVSRWRSSGKVPRVENHALAAKGILASGVTSVDILVLPESELRRRIATRTEYGDDIGRAPQEGQYPSKLKLRVLDRCPLTERYSIWIDYFEQLNVPIRYVHSGDRRYAVVPDRKTALQVIRGRDVWSFGGQWFSGRFGNSRSEPAVNDVGASPETCGQTRF